MPGAGSPPGCGCHPAGCHHAGNEIFFLGFPHLRAGRGHRYRARRPPRSPPALLCPAPARGEEGSEGLGAARAPTPHPWVLPSAGQGPSQLWGRHPGSETFGDAAPAQANAKFPARNTIKEEVLPMQNSSGSSAGNKTGTAGAEPPPPTSPNRTGLPAPPKPPGSRRAQPQPCWCFSAPTRTQSLEHHPQKCFGAIHVPPNILFSENLSVWICGTATQPLRNLPVSSFYKPAPGRAVGLAARLAG